MCLLFYVKNKDKVLTRLRKCVKLIKNNSRNVFGKFRKAKI